MTTNYLTKIGNTIRRTGSQVFSKTAGRRLCATAVCVLAATFQLSAQTFTVDGINYAVTGIDSVEVYDNYRYAGTTVSIPASVRYDTVNYSVRSIGENAFYYCTALTSVSIADSVSSIGDGAFAGCGGLTAVGLPAALVSIGDGAFAGCGGLTAVGLPATLVSIGGNAFSGCVGLTELTLPGSVVSIGDKAFTGCTGLSSVAVPGSVTSIAPEVFAYCSGLTSVTIPRSVVAIGDKAFCFCVKLASVVCQAETPPSLGNEVYSFVDSRNCVLYVPAGAKARYGAADGWKDFENIVEAVFVSSNVNLRQALTEAGIPDASTVAALAVTGGPVRPDDFEYIRANMAGSLQSLNLSAAAMSGGAIPRSALRHCTGLTAVALPGSVTSVGDGAFDGCINLTSVNIPDSIASIGDYTFRNCGGLTSVRIPNTVASIGGNAFYGCSGLTSVDMPDAVASIGDSAFSGCSGLTSVVIPGSVRSIGSHAFSGCAGLTSVVIPGSATFIGDHAFSGCGGLTSVVIPGSVTSVGNHAFSGCGGLTSVVIPNSITAIENSVFENCIGLSTVVIPGSVKTVGSSAFSGCVGLTSVIIPRSVKSVGSRAFSGCGGLTSVVVPDSVIVVESRVFSGCAGLTSVVIPVSARSIGDSAFSGCGGLTSVVIPDSVRSVGNHAFSGCSGLTSVVVPGSVKTVGNSAFRGCVGLTSVSIPETVTTIGVEAFYGCPGLSVASCYAATPPSLGADAYDGSVRNGVLYVPAGAKARYEAADGWKDFGFIIEISANPTAGLGFFRLSPSSAAPSPAFHSDSVSYTARTANSVAEITITAYANHPNAVVSGGGNKALTTGGNVFKLTVVSENGATVVYTLTVTRMSDDATLKSITLGAGTLSPVFSPDTTEYTVNAANSTEYLAVNGTATHAGATVEGNANNHPLAVGENTVTIAVTSEDGSVRQTYRVTIVRAASDDATLKSLTVSSGVLSPAFSENVTEYAVSLAHGVANITVRGTSNHEKAKVDGNVIDQPTVVGDNVVEITVTAENKTTTKIYRITLTRAVSDDSRLKDLNVNGETLSPAFSSDTTEYTVKVENRVAAVSITGTAVNPKATVSGDGNKTLSTGVNVFAITVTAEDGTTRRYRITVIRAASDDATLKSLTVSAGSLSPAFSSGTTAYTVNVANEIAEITVTGAANHAEAAVAGNVTDKPLAVDNNVVEIAVTAEDKTSRRIYTVTVVRARSDAAELEEIKIKNVALTDSVYLADCNETSVDLDVKVSAEAGVTVTANGRACGSEAVSLRDDVTEIKIGVTSESGKTKEYSFKIASAFDGKLLYKERWKGETIALNKNAATNGGYDITGIRWYSNGEFVGTENFITISGNVNDCYAEIETGGVWHKVCHSDATLYPESIVAYPNPVSLGENLMLKLPERFDGGKLDVFAPSGTQVKSGVKLSLETTSLNVAELVSANGIYLLHFTDKSGNKQVLKIIINH